MPLTPSLLTFVSLSIGPEPHNMVAHWPGTCGNLLNVVPHLSAVSHPGSRRTLITMVGVNRVRCPGDSSSLRPCQEVAAGVYTRNESHPHFFPLPSQTYSHKFCSPSSPSMNGTFLVFPPGFFTTNAEQPSGCPGRFLEDVTRG